MSGRELDPDGTDSYHPEHPWEQTRHPLYLPPGQRTSLNWPPEPAYPHGPHEAKQWDQLPVRVQLEPAWRREYGYAHPKARTPLRCKLRTPLMARARQRLHPGTSTHPLRPLRQTPLTPHPLKNPARRPEGGPPPGRASSLPGVAPPLDSSPRSG